MLKVGYMEYANVYPIFYHLLNLGNISLIKGYPSELNKLVRNRDIDISPSSSIEFARNPELYKIFPDISVSSIGAVKSVNIFSNYPIEELSGKTIKFTKESNTSTILCRIVLEEFHNLSPVYSDSENYDAELLIGDKALHRYYNPTMPYVYDLGDLWYKKTGLPFVFALWICRATDSNIEQLHEFAELLRKYSAKTNDYSNNLVSKYTSLGYTAEQIVDYWNVIDYRLSVKHIEGLSLFYKYAHKLGEIESDACERLKASFLL